MEPQSQGGGPGPAPAPAQSRGATAGPTRYHGPLALRAELRDTAGSEIQFRLDHERRLRVAQGDREAVGSLPPEDEGEQRACLEVRRGGLEPHEGLEGPGAPQERALLQQELRLFRHNTVIFYMKLRWILTHWRLGRRAEHTEETPHPEFEKLEGLPDLGAIMEQAEGEMEREDRQSAGRSPGEDVSDLGPVFHVSPEPQQHHQRQFGENRRMLQALRALLEEFRVEARDEETRRRQLQQSYANDKAAWEVKWAEIRCQTAQWEAQGGEGALQQEHQRLLAESHNASLDLRWKLQHSEKRWSRERAELLEGHGRDRQAWDCSTRELHCKMERLQRELNRRGEGVEFRDGGSGYRGALSPQDSPCNAPRSPVRFIPLSPSTSTPAVSAPALATRSHSESDAALEDQGTRVTARLKAPMESLFLDALSLDPLSGRDVPPPSRLEGEKRFPCVNKALNELCEREGPSEYPEDEMSGGSLLRAKSVCSMSDFQRLMDSSPFLPDKNRHGDQGRDDATPPLSPDDLKYIEEFNSKGWDSPSAAAGHGALLEAWTPDRPPGARTGEPPPSWFLTTSATLTTSTLSSPDHCHKSSLRGNGAGAVGVGAGAEHYGIHLLHSPTRPMMATECAAAPETDFLYARGTKARGGGESAPGPAPDEVFGGGRWPCGLLETGGLHPPPSQSPLCPTVGYASSLDLQLSRNLSDDMKEVAFSVRNAIRSSPGAAVRDTACQTNGFTTRGTQTTQTISVGLQTDVLRTLTSSPHRCLTPKGGGSTPISSPSRSLRKVPYSPVVPSKFERPCCSPKYGSPKLQRKASTCSKAEPPGTGRAPAPTALPQKGNSESAWARSTTTRDSPVHTTINDGLSSLFNIIDHTPVVYDPLQKFNKSPSRSRSTPPPTAEPSPAHGPPAAGDPRHAAAVQQELLRTCRGRSPSPVQLVVETQGDRTPEMVSIRQDLSAPPGYSLAENAARLLNRKMLEQGFQDRRLQVGGQGREGPRQTDTDKGQSGCIEDLPRSPVAPPLDSCFLRPARPTHRRPPSRWATHSPSSSPTWSADSQRGFAFLPPGHSKTTPEHQGAPSPT